MSDGTGVLYIVATPIGNLADISRRALEVLQRVDLIAAEDTRHSRKLLSHYGINTPMMALHEHNEREQANEIVNSVSNGKSVALISDAGTPLISDPGYYLTRLAHEAGIRVVPIPGPSALIAALSASGMPTDRFVFEGFLPSRATARDDYLQQLSTEPRTMVFYEAPHRLLETVTAICNQFGANRNMVLARELTKTYETIRQASCEEMLNWLNANAQQQKGESVLIVEGKAEDSQQDQLHAEIDIDRLLEVLLTGMSVRDAARNASELTGLGKNDLYQRALQIHKRQSE